VRRVPDGDRATTLLLACLRHGAPAPVGKPARREDVRQMHVLAARHGVNPILYRRLARLSGHGMVLAADDEQLFRAAYHHSRLRARATRTEIAGVLRAISGAGVPVIALKGTFLAEHVYDDEALRPMGDLDLLVPAERAEDAAAAVLALGYRWDESSSTRAVDYATHHHLRRLVLDGRLPVELHRALTRADVSWRVDPRDLWRRAQPARVRGVDALALAPEHLLLHLVLHAATHRFVVPLLAIEDIALVAERLAPTDGWPRFVDVAHAARAGGLAYATLALARTLLAARIPDAALAALSHASDDASIVPSLARTVLDQFTELPASYERALAERGGWARVSLLLRGLVPSPARLQAQEGLAPWSPAMASYYLRRPFDLARRHGKSFRALVTPRRYRDGRAAVERWLARA